MSEDKGLNPVILDIAALSAAVASRCPSTTAELIGRLNDRGVPDHQLREIIEIARNVATESWQRAAGMIDAALAGEPLEGCQPRDAAGTGTCCTDSSEGCCGEPTSKTTCC